MFYHLKYARMNLFANFPGCTQQVIIQKAFIPGCGTSVKDTMLVFHTHSITNTRRPEIWRPSINPQLLWEISTCCVRAVMNCLWSFYDYKKDDFYNIDRYVPPPQVKKVFYVSWNSNKLAIPWPTLLTATCNRAVKRVQVPRSRHNTTYILRLKTSAKSKGKGGIYMFYLRCYLTRRMLTQQNDKVIMQSAVWYVWKETGLYLHSWSSNFKTKDPNPCTPNVTGRRAPFAWTQSL